MRLIIFLCGSLGLMAVTRLVRPPVYSAGVQGAVDYFKSESVSFAGSCSRLRKAVEGHSLKEERQALVDCRYHYKHIESFIEYFFRSSSTIYNRAPKFEAEEGGMEYQSPIGMQLIESMLYEPRVDQKVLLEQVDAVESAATDLPALLYGLRADDRQVLESLRVELIRIMALDITGYEAPLLKSGIRESYAAMEAFAYQLQPYMVRGEERSDSIRFFLDRVMARLNRDDFDGFDRMGFLRDAVLPLQRQLGLLIRERKLELNTSKTLNYSADDLFSADALSPEKFPAAAVGSGQAQGGGALKDSAALVQLGKQLFSDKRLSGNGQKSCASCHSPEKAFTDRLPVSIGLDGHTVLDRNAPTLLYSAYQFNQFWDGRAKSLEDQIRTVLLDKREMRADTVKQEDITAIAAYVRSLHPMNSPFDRYMRGEGEKLSAAAIKGANLFLGKAQCGTCHFMPLFNGLIPPDYALSEFEVLGTTATDRFTKGVRLSKDEGRYKQYPLPFFKGAFKTPTVRDAALTAPYMHNGAFNSLETVMEFYNKGGGAGMGLTVPDQTLTSVPLHLSVDEIKDIILFIHTLTDTLNPSP
jgi:cytochrome c peroxidase